MDERGWALTLLPDAQGPGFRMDTPEDQREAMRLDMQECQGKIGKHPFTALDASTAHKLYGEVLTRRQCLVAAGFEISQPPSEATWVDKQIAQDPQNIPWDPYDDVSDLNQADWTTMVAKCPRASLWGVE